MVASFADDVIARFLLGQRGSEAAVETASVAVLRRFFGLWTGTDVDPLPNGLPVFRSSQDVDRWNDLLRRLASAHPAVFVELVAGTPEARPSAPRDTRAIAGILGALHRPDAAHLVRGFLADTNDAVRWNAVRALGMNSDVAEARAGLQDALADGSNLVRLQAMSSMAGWTLERALHLIEGLLASESLPPLMESKARAAVDDLRERGRDGGLLRVSFGGRLTDAGFGLLDSRS